MKKIRIFIFSSIFIALLIPGMLRAADLNDIAYEDRVNLNAGTIWNYQGNGDCLIFPYYDVRQVGGENQVTQINIENSGAYGIAAKLRFRDPARGKEVFSKDIWIPSKAIWNAKVEISEDGTNAIITGPGNVILRSDSHTFYFTNPLVNGVPFSTRNVRQGSTLYGFIEVIGEEKTAPDDAGSDFLEPRRTGHGCAGVGPVCGDRCAGVGGVEPGGGWGGVRGTRTAGTGGVAGQRGRVSPPRSPTDHRHGRAAGGLGCMCRPVKE